MITNTINSVDELIGKANTEQTFQLRIERSDEMLEYNMLNLDRDVSLSKRPNGILLSSVDNNGNSFYFTLPCSDIISVSILETFTEDSRYNFSYTLAFLFSILFASINIFETKVFGISTLLLSLVFGITISSLFPKPKRQNIFFKYLKDGSEKRIVFSFRKQHKQMISDFITSNFSKTL
jgi:hypothetical protein